MSSFVNAHLCTAYYPPRSFNLALINIIKIIIHLQSYVVNK